MTKARKRTHFESNLDRLGWQVRLLERRSRTEEVARTMANGESRLEEAIHHNSSIRNVCAYGTSLHLLNRLEAAPKVELHELQDET